MKRPSGWTSLLLLTRQTSQTRVTVGSRQLTRGCDRKISHPDSRSLAAKSPEPAPSIDDALISRGIALVHVLRIPLQRSGRLWNRKPSLPGQLSALGAEPCDVAILATKSEAGAGGAGRGGGGGAGGGGGGGGD